MNLQVKKPKQTVAVIFPQLALKTIKALTSVINPTTALKISRTKSAFGV